jgi:hypothetical protein
MGYMAFFKSQFIVASMFFCVLTAMEQNNKSIGQRTQEIIQSLHNKEVMGRPDGNRIFITLPNGPEKLPPFRYLHDKHGNLALTVFDACNHSTEKLQTDCCLLEAARYGFVENFKKAIDDPDFDRNATDTRVYQALFNLEKADGTLYRRNDPVTPGEGFRLVQGKIPVVVPFPYGNTYGFTALEYAFHGNQHHILRLINEHSDRFKISGDEKNKIESYLKQVNEESKMLPEIYENLHGMGFPIEQKSANNNSIDRLSRLFVSIIGTDEVKGEILIGRFNNWKQYEILTVNIFERLIAKIRLEPYDKKTFCVKNLLDFSQKIIKDENIFCTGKAQELVSYFLMYSLLHSQNGNNNKLNDTYYLLLGMLVQNQNGKVLLKVLSDDKNNNNVFVPTVKPFMQKELFRNFVARELTRANHPIGKDLAQLIASHWELTDEYKNYFKNLPSLKRNLPDIEMNVKRSKKE